MKIYIILVLSFIIIIFGTLLFIGQAEKEKRQANLLARMRDQTEPGSCKTSLLSVIKHIPFFAQIEKKQSDKKARQSYTAELPRMLEIIALGVRAGLGFDQAFALYVYRFDTPLATVCRERFAVWERGLITREQGLRELAKTLDITMFSRFVSTTLRALNYGAALNALLLDLAKETRKDYRAELSELVAKAPVKMLLPTGALILPAMLLLVIGPILLELAERMS